MNYRAYGLNIHAEIDLPELAASVEEHASEDVRIEFGKITLPFAPRPGLVYRPVKPGVTVAQWPTVGSLRAEGGYRLVCDPVEGVPDVVFRLFVICQGLALILQQRGGLVLHAGAVAFDDSVVAFAGTHGEGKSTLVAACCSAGARLITDDTLAISLGRSQAPGAWPSFPRMKLRTGQYAAPPGFDPLGEPIGAIDKRLHAVRTDFPLALLPLRRIYFLSSGDGIAITRESPHDAFRQLCEHTYGRALIPFLKIEAAHMQQCGSLITADLVRRLTRPRSLDTLPEVVDSIVQDLSRSPGANGASNERKLVPSRHPLELVRNGRSAA